MVENRHSSSFSTLDENVKVSTDDLANADLLVVVISEFSDIMKALMLLHE